MHDYQHKLYVHIVERIRSPILLFSIFFALVLLSLGVYDSEKILALRVPLITFFVLGLAAALLLSVFSRESSGGIRGTKFDSVPGVTEILPDRNWTSHALKNANPETKKIKMLAISGQTTSLPANVRESFALLKRTEIQFLLLSPESKYVARRLEENPSRSLEGLVNHIRCGIDLLHTARDDNNLERFHLRTYDDNPVFRLLIIDELAYVSYYPRGPAESVPVFVIRERTSWMFSAFEKYFDSLYERSDTVF